LKYRIIFLGAIWPNKPAFILILIIVGTLSELKASKMAGGAVDTHKTEEVSPPSPAVNNLG
jgi:hypothetical protein